MDFESKSIWIQILSSCHGLISLPSWTFQLFCPISLLQRQVGGFPCSSAGKESTSNAGDPSSIPGLGKSPGEGIGYPLQYSWASLVVQMVKNLPAMWKTWVWSLGCKDPLKVGMATHFSGFLSGESPWTEEPGRLWSMESQSQTRLSYFHFLSSNGLYAFKNSRVFRIGTSSSPFYLPFPMFSPGIWNIWFSKSDETSWFILFFSFCWWFYNVLDGI